MKIPITKPVFDKAERINIIKPLASGWVVQGKFVAEFERLFAAFTQAKFTVAVTSCTTALHLALVALKIKPGDKVIVPSFTFIATANAVEYAGAEPVFCDIDLRTFNIDVEQVEKLLVKDKGHQIKAIIPVHLFGLCADMAGILRLARKYHLKVVEDSACGFDSWVGNKHSGTFGDAGCFSFHPRKVITTGEGGMIITNNTKLARKVFSLRDHGANKSDLQRHTGKDGSLLPEYNLRGYNYRMTDFQGAVGVCQMQKANAIMSKRRKIAKKYNDLLKDEKRMAIPFVPQNYRHAYQSYVCLFTGGVDRGYLIKYPLSQIDKLGKIRNRIMFELGKSGIAVRQGTHAVHTLDYYKNKYGLGAGDYYHSYIADKLSITLPLYASMTAKEFAYIISNLSRVLDKCAV